MDNQRQIFSDNYLEIRAFYVFSPLTEAIINSLLDQLSVVALAHDIKGTILLAKEGVNGTICGPGNGVEALVQVIQNSILEKSLEIKVSWTKEQAFRRLKIRRKAEIVTMGVEGIDPLENVGDYVKPSDWNELINDPETIVIDTRNDYEIGIGSFEGSLNPHTDCFNEFPEWVDKHLRILIEERQAKRIAMFCTGGIRCEKATSYLKQEGFAGVHHLQGGILRYLEEVPKNESLWQGECFVFDRRVAVNHELLPGEYKLCHACGMPLSPKQIESLNYIHGIQCCYCKTKFTDLDRARFAERQRQYDNCSRKNKEKNRRNKKNDF